jgi:hypothetical protein
MKVIKMAREINFNEWFGSKSKCNCGVEIELLLFDSRNKEPMQRGDIVEKILTNINSITGGKNVWKDFYPWQLEIRTEAHDNPEALIKETKAIYNLCAKEFSKHKIYIIPTPTICNGMQAYCGMHVHVSYPDSKDNDDYYRKAMGMYPFMLALADHSKNCEQSTYANSERLDKSRHIGFPRTDKKEFMRGNQGDYKYKDIILSNPISNPESKSRLIKPLTIEVRLLDTPSLFTFYEFMIHHIFNVVSRIRVDNPIVKLLESNPTQVTNKLVMTRDLLTHQRYGVNKIFNMLNVDVCQCLGDYFGYPIPRQTQFEFREEQGLSANVNGYLAMAIQGGWI